MDAQELLKSVAYSHTRDLESWGIGKVKVLGGSGLSRSYGKPTPKLLVLLTEWPTVFESQGEVEACGVKTLPLWPALSQPVRRKSDGWVRFHSGETSLKQFVISGKQAGADFPSRGASTLDHQWLGKFAVLMAAVFMVCGRKRTGARMALVRGRFGDGQSRKLTLPSYQKSHHPLFHHGGSVTRPIVFAVREPTAPSPIFTATPSPVFITAQCRALLALTSSALLFLHQCSHNPNIIAVEFLPKRLWRRAQS